jgi:hypothetical protein
MWEMNKRRSFWPCLAFGLMSALGVPQRAIWRRKPSPPDLISPVMQQAVMLLRLSSSRHFRPERDVVLGGSRRRPEPRPLDGAVPASPRRAGPHPQVGNLSPGTPTADRGQVKIEGEAKLHAPSACPSPSSGDTPDQGPAVPRCQDLVQYRARGLAAAGGGPRFLGPLAVPPFLWRNRRA